MKQQISAAEMRQLTPCEGFTAQLVAVPGIDRDQFQAMQQRARVRDELHMPASRARQNRVAGIAGRQAGPHKLISLQLLFAAQATNCLAIGIGRDTTRRLDGWFHTFP